MIQRLALAALVVTAAACSQPEPEPAPPPAPPAILAGVPLDQPVRALGTEPFWGLDITPPTLTLTGVDRPEQTAANPGPVVQGTVATYTTVAQSGQALVVTLLATECSDGMSDRAYPLTARVEIGDTALNGCALPTSALATAPAP